MKNILIVIPSFEIGGTIVSVNSLLKNIDRDKVNVDVFARHHIGPFYNKLPNSSLLDENMWLSSAIYRRGNLYKTAFLFLKIIRNLFKLIGVNLYPIYSYIGGKQIGSDKYDAVISYQEDLNRVVAFYPAKKRIAWIHCDYKRYLSIIGKNNEEKIYERFDFVACVSNFVKRTFDSCYPQYAGRSVCIYNIIDKDYIVKRSKENIELDHRFKTDCFTIVSIGRLDSVKQFSIIPSIANELSKKYGESFVWYIIGGPDSSDERRKIESNILNYGVDSFVKCLGEKANVYPYIKDSNLLVHTSKSESFSLVVNEAMALGIPVIMNDIEVAPEVINNGIDGIIVDLASMADTIHKVIKGDYHIVQKEFDVSKTVDIFYSII